MTKSEAPDAAKAFVTMRFAGDRLDPEEISRVLNFRPTQAYRKGEVYSSGSRSGTHVGRTGVWYIASNSAIPGQNLDHHLGFIFSLLFPGPGDVSRVIQLRELMKKKSIKAHVTLFWHGRPGVRKPTIKPVVADIFKLIPADVQIDFAAEDSTREVA